MRAYSVFVFGAAAASFLVLGANGHANEQDAQGRIENVVHSAVRPLMQEHDIPGMAVAITIEGKRYFFNYGVASKETNRPVTNDTIFELGSISKTFTATLASYAEATGILSLSDPASRHLPSLQGSAFDRISLLNLGTYTAGGLPLQFPDDVDDQDKLVAFYKNWRPAHAPGTHRLYSNPSIGLFGFLVAESMGEPFDDLMEKKIFPKLGLAHTFINVPKDRMDAYAFGYSKTDKPIRVSPGVLDSQAYGVKSTSADMIRYIEANMKGAGLDATLDRALAATHTGYFKLGAMTQGLGWEFYPYPADFSQLRIGNSIQVILEANEVVALSPPVSPRRDVLINKTGSTNGFGAYVAFIPARDIGIVMLANRNYPIPARIEAAYRILTTLDSKRD